MGAKFCLILGILLLSNILFISTEVMAREMLQELQAAEEMKSEADARSISYHPLKPGTPRAGARKGKPYTRPCLPRNNCERSGKPGTPRAGARKGKPYTRPCLPGNNCERSGKPGTPRGKPYRRPCTYGKNCRRPPGPGS